MISSYGSTLVTLGETSAGLLVAAACQDGATCYAVGRTTTDVIGTAARMSIFGDAQGTGDTHSDVGWSFDSEADAVASWERRIAGED